MSKPQGKELIQTAILNSVKNRDFPRVTYANDTDLPEVSATLRPSRSTRTNEISCDFEVDSNHGRSFRLRRRTWTFLLQLKFDKEVTIEEWINEITDTPLKVKDPSGKLVGRIELQRYAVTHPVTHNSSAGSEFAITFSVNNFRKY